MIIREVEARFDEDKFLTLYKKPGKQHKDIKGIITSPEMAIQILKRGTDICERPEEHFYVMYLDVRKRCIALHHVSIGGLTGAMVHPSDVFKVALLVNAHGMILCHNHPSGDPSPSTADMEATQRFVDLGRMMGISVVDHIIFGDEDRVLSFKEKGYL